MVGDWALAKCEVSCFLRWIRQVRALKPPFEALAPLVLVALLGSFHFGELRNLPWF